MEKREKISPDKKLGFPGSALYRDFTRNIAVGMFGFGINSRCVTADVPYLIVPGQ